jgi:predicted AAA+ superfamily ATPase
LTESAKGVEGVFLVVSIPASDTEIGGEGGKAALDRLKNAVGRIQSPWRPASAEESFEIVRRRLFQPITEGSDFADRDAVVKAFGSLYRSQVQEFPSECREKDYERRLEAAYPIHPELFDRLYGSWASLERFQRTRGVLRLMAAVIHILWERQDSSLLIMPATVPVDSAPVQSELTRYLEDPWVPVIEKDVDGPHSLPLSLDRNNPNLGRYSACRRVARAIYMGSAPTLRTAHRGIEETSIKLGCVQPGESVAIFGDALRRLTDQATHLYVDGKRYWFSTQPSVTRLAQDRTERWEHDVVDEEIIRRIRLDRQRADFIAVHVAPGSSADIPDDMEARLVVISPDHPHAAKSVGSKARVRASEILERRGGAPRLYRNMLIFLAPDAARLEDLRQAVRSYLAWKSICDEHTELNLDAFQQSQAETKRAQADDSITQRIPEAYQWALVPTQLEPQGEVEWEELRLQGQEPLAVRASKKLRHEEYLITEFAASRLRMELDRIPLWRGNHVGLKQLWEDFAQYLYLPRLKAASVLVGAIQDGLGLLTWEQDAFAYAEAWDEAEGRYRGLRAGEQGSVIVDGRSVLVKPKVARSQVAAEPGGGGEAGGGQRTGGETGTDGVDPGGGTDVVVAPLKRFHGTVSLDPLRLKRDIDQVADAIVQHLSGQLGASVEVTLEIQAELPNGASEEVVRTVTENAKTLKFNSHGFERD